ncbi:MAG: OmpA family protein [Planctomycetes bacterium]|nr:OmpA family protein [Planctomycetota bacterium]
MFIRKSILFLSLILASLSTSCTTRYQDMLRERDERIRELSGDNARLRGENQDLQARAPAAPVDASTQRPDNSSMLAEINKELGEGAEARYVRGRVSIGVENSVTFNSGSTKLLDGSHTVLRKVAGVLKGQFAGKRLYVEGHTDTDPISRTKDQFTSNRHLSALRADAVASFLIQQGVPASSIVIVGYGEYDPRDATTKAQNRRVEVVVGEQI